MFKNEEENREENQEKEIEIIIGDDSNLSISEVNDYMSDLNPDTEKKKKVIIPTAKKKVKPEDKESKKEDKK
ncbi:MAG: hypothetical protein IKN74_06185 [Clostridia bacterium]|nr:hypothetical protein [Clostridia bacterium]